MSPLLVWSAVGSVAAAVAALAMALGHVIAFARGQGRLEQRVEALEGERAESGRLASAVGALEKAVAGLDASVRANDAWTGRLEDVLGRLEERVYSRGRPRAVEG